MRRRRVSRRRFMATTLAAAPAVLGAGLPSVPWWTAAAAEQPSRRALGFPIPQQAWHGDSSVAAAARVNALPGDQDRRRPPRTPPERSPAPPPPSEWQRFAAQLAVF